MPHGTRVTSLSQLTMLAYSMRTIQDGQPIPDEVARMIAGTHAASGEVALAALEQTGAIDLPRVLAELNARLEHFQGGTEPELSAGVFALQAYVLLHGSREAVAGWPEQKIEHVVSRYADHERDDYGRFTFAWDSPALLTELIARQRADYTPVFVAALSPAEWEDVAHIAVTFDAHLDERSTPAGVIPIFGVGLVVAVQDDGHEVFTWDHVSFTALVSGLRWYATHQHRSCLPTCRLDDAQRSRARTLYLEIAEALGVTVKTD